MEEKQLILELKFDTDEGLKRAALLRSAIDADKEALSEFNKIIKKNGELNGEQLLQREKLEQNLKKNTKARQDELRAVESYQKVTKANTGSIKEMRSELSFLTEKWNGLSKAERENTEIGGKMQKEVKRLSDELKGLEGSVGDNRRSVGGYLDAIRQAPGAMGKFKAGIDGIGLAMKANPFGLLLSLLPMIATLFNKSGDGADFFAKTMAQVNAVIEVGLKRVVTLGEAISLLLDGKFKEAGEKGKAAFRGIGAEIQNNVRSAGELADRLDALDIAESRFAVTSAKTRKEIDQLLIQAKNRTTSEAERIKILERAEKLEVDLNRKALAQAKERLALIKAENKIKQDDYEEEEKRVNEQLNRITELQRESLNIQEKIQNRKDALLDAAAEREKKRREDAQKAAEKAFIENRERLQKEAEALEKHYQATKDRLKKESEAIGKNREDFLNAANDKLKGTTAFIKGQIDQYNLDQQEQKRLSDLKIKQKEDEFRAVSTIANGLSALTGVLAEQNSEFAAFQKALTVVQIAMSTAEAISKGIASVAGLVFPANLVAIAPTIGTILANMAQATALIQQDIPKAPAVKRFATGGLLDGPSHAEGGIKGTGSFAGVEVEGGEAIITKKATAMFGPILSAINMAGGGKPLAPTRYAALGGFIPGGMVSGSSSQIDYRQLAKAVASEFQNIPAPVVSVSDLSGATMKRDNRIRKVTLGA